MVAWAWTPASCGEGSATTDDTTVVEDTVDELDIVLDTAIDAAVVDTEVAADTTSTVEVQVKVVAHGSGFRSPIAPSVMEPVTHATVALALEDGTPLGEATTDGEGVATFALAPDAWGAGVRGEVTAAAEGYIVGSVVGVQRPDAGETLTLALYSVLEAEPPLVEVSGVVSNGEPGADIYVFPVQSGIDWYQGDPPSYAFDVPEGVEVDIVATDFDAYWTASGSYTQTFHHWARVAAGPFEEDTEVDIDLEADGVGPGTSSGSFRLAQPRKGTWSGYYLIIFEGPPGSGAAVGFASSLDLSDETLVTFETEYFRRGGADYHYYYRDRLESGEAESLAYGQGVPKGDLPTLLPLPEVVDWDKETLTATWTEGPSGAAPRIWIGTGSTVVWVIDYPEGTTTGRLPLLPSGREATVLSGYREVLAVYERAPDDEGAVYLLRAKSVPVPFTPTLQ